MPAVEIHFSNGQLFEGKTFFAASKNGTGFR